MCVLTIVTEKEFDDVNHSGRNEWKAGLHLPKSLIGHNKRSAHLRKSVFIVVDLGEEPSPLQYLFLRYPVVSLQNRFAASRYKSTRFKSKLIRYTWKNDSLQMLSRFAAISKKIS